MSIAPHSLRLLPWSLCVPSCARLPVPTFINTRLKLMPKDTLRITILRYSDSRISDESRAQTSITHLVYVALFKSCYTVCLRQDPVVVNVTWCIILSPDVSLEWTISNQTKIPAFFITTSRQDWPILDVVPNSNNVYNIYNLIPAYILGCRHGQTRCVELAAIGVA